MTTLKMIFRNAAGELEAIQKSSDAGTAPNVGEFLRLDQDDTTWRVLERRFNVPGEVVLLVEEQK